MREIAVFGGTAHPALTAEICAHLNVPQRPVLLKRFANDCLEVQLQSNCRERDVFVIQPLVKPVQENLVELLLMADAARGASAARVTAVIPHYAYGRSDKKDAPRISIGGRLVADLLVTAGREPGAHAQPALAAGARLLLGAGGSPARAARAGRPLPRPGPVQRRGGLTRPGLRQERRGVRPQARPAGRGGRQGADQRHRGADHRHHRRRGRPGRDRAGRRDLARHHRVRAARPAARRRRALGGGGLHARPVRRQLAGQAGPPPT